MEVDTTSGIRAIFIMPWVTVCGLCLEDSNSGQLTNKKAADTSDYKSQPIEKGKYT